MVTPRRQAVNTVAFIDNYCQHYYSLFEDVRHFEAFKFLHLGILSEISRKSLPEIAKKVGLKDSQTLHHFLRDALWDVKKIREIRLCLTKMFIGEREIILCIDETGDKKKGKSTDYVTRQYIGNLGKTENGIVSVNAYGVVDGITYPLMFQIFKPKNCLKEGDKYKSKPQIALEIIQELKAWGFQIKLVLADSLYGESGDVIRCLEKLELEFIVAIRSNHGVLMPAESRKHYNRWKAYEQKLSHRPTETRYVREIIFGQHRRIRYYQISKVNTPEPTGDESWYIMTNLSIDLSSKIAQFYGLINWIEYGFKEVKNELGWADFRLTDYQSIERWWEIIFSAYLLVSVQTTYFH
jgi:SRSO17 transposase